MLKHILEYPKSINEQELSYSGKDVTKMPIIGKVVTKAIGPFEPAEYDVVETIQDPRGNTIYVCNTWYKEWKRIPQLIHSELVSEYIPVQNSETLQG